MIVDEIRNTLNWLEGQLRQAVNDKRNAERERDESGQLVDAFRRMKREKEDQIYEAYQKMQSGLQNIQSAHFKNQYNERMKNILFGRKTQQMFETLEAGIAGAQRNYAEAEDQISRSSRRIRDLEDQISYHRSQMIKAEEEAKNGGQ